MNLTFIKKLVLLISISGFLHEHVRPDHDQYLTVSWPKVPPEEELLTVIDTVEVALAYSCTLDQQQMINYINISRISWLQKMEEN